MKNDLNKIFHGPTPASCPSCKSPEDWHPDPSGPNGEAWMVCESCGFVIDHKGKGLPHMIFKD